MGSLVWDVMESWVRDPRCLDKFSFYIDYRSTAYCEMFMSKKLKWLPKSNHRTRFYMNGIWFAICDHDENVDREVLGPRWHRGNTLKHPGRFYTTNVRVVTTDEWRRVFKNTMMAQARVWSAVCESSAVLLPEPKLQPTYLVRADDSRITTEVAAVMESLMQSLGAGDAEVAAEVGGAVTSADAEVRGWLRGLVSQVVEQAAAAPPSEVHIRIARVAAESAAAARAKESSGGAKVLLEPAQVTVEGARKMLQAQLAEALEDRGLDKTGRKAEQLARLIEALEAGDAAPGAEGEEGDKDDEAEEAGSSKRPKVAASDPLAIAEAAGIAAQWYMVTCPICSSLLQARLPDPLTQLCCSSCHTLFVAPNAHIAQLPAVPLWKPRPPRKRSPLMLEKERFAKVALLRLAQEQPEVSQQDRMRLAMKEWLVHKSTLDLTLYSPSPPAQPASVLPVAGSKRPVIAEPLDSASGAIASKHRQNPHEVL